MVGTEGVPTFIPTNQGRPKHVIAWIVSCGRVLPMPLFSEKQKAKGRNGQARKHGNNGSTNRPHGRQSQEVAQ